MRYRVGIDIGGTFSDLVILGDDGHVSTLKVSSDPVSLVAGLIEGLNGLQQQADLAPGDAIAVVHGTTAATNAILEYRGARTGLLTTKGFRDILEIRRLRVGRLYDLGWDKPQPLVPRRLRREVPERVDVHGQVVEALDEAAARTAVERLLADRPEAVAVVFIHAYANGDHERRVGQLLREKAPNLFLSMSHEVLPEIGEYERTSTTVVNAYVGPILDRYLGALEAGLAEAGMTAPLLMMQSNGGVIRASTARARPVQVVESGPAGGVIAAVRLGRQCDIPHLITVDMGGTTAKASIVEDGRPFQVAEYEVGAGISVGSRMFRGGGHTLRVPALDIAEVGAGGGSLIRVDSGGGLRVGPESAGASPGPVCYGLGNEQPTLTDANLVLGYLNQTHLLGGSLPIDGEAAHHAVKALVADPLGLDIWEAAYGAHQIAVSNMVRVARAVSTERGRDPRRCTLVAFGGNGPVHAAEVARQLGIAEVIVPPWPGLFSAFGLLAAETRLELSQANRRPLAACSAADLLTGFASLEENARATLRGEGHRDQDIDVERILDLRYRGQSSELRIAVPALSGETELFTIAASFEDEHERTYGYRDATDRVEVVSFRLVARVVVDLPLARVVLQPSSSPTTRRAYFGREHGALETPVVGRGDLTVSPQSGPVIVEEYDATTVVPPGWSALLDRHGNIRLTTCG